MVMVSSRILILVLVTFSMPLSLLWFCRSLWYSPLTFFWGGYKVIVFFRDWYGCYWLSTPSFVVSFQFYCILLWNRMGRTANAFENGAYHGICGGICTALFSTLSIFLSLISPSIQFTFFDCYWALSWHFCRTIYYKHKILFLCGNK